MVGARLPSAEPALRGSGIWVPLLRAQRAPDRDDGDYRHEDRRAAASRSAVITARKIAARSARAAPQRTHAQEQEKDADRVDLAPHARCPFRRPG